MRTRFVAAVLAAALVLTSAAACRKKAPDPTAWQNVAAMIGPNGEVSLDMAVKAFALTYGPLPGVEVPKGRLGNGSGTPAATWVLDHWGELSAEQRDKVAAYLRLPAEATAPPAPSAGPTGVVIQPPPANPIGCDGQGRPTPIPTSPFPTEGFPEEVLPVRVKWAMDAIEARLGKVTPPLRPVLCQSTQDIPSPLEASTLVMADAISWFHDDGNFDCRITFFPEGLKARDRLPSRAVVVHELMHCYMGRMAGRAAGAHWAKRIPPWINEGIATFAASDITQDVAAHRPAWDAYIDHPEQPLSGRTYDAMGFFWHIDNARHDMWRTIEPVVKAGASEDSFKAAVSKDSERVLNNLPSSWLRDPSRGAGADYTAVGPWDMRGVGSGSDKPLPSIGSVTNGTQNTTNVNAWANNLKLVSLKTEVLMFDVGPGAQGRFGPGKDGNFTLAEASTKLFCVKQGGCVCPDGTVPPVPFTDIPGGDSYVSVTGGTLPASVTLTGQKLEDYCKDPKPPKGPSPLPPGQAPDVPAPPAGGCAPSASGGGGGSASLQPAGASCAVSNGDPHLITFDGVYYDMQAVGEFIMTKSTVDSLEVQARTAAVPGVANVSVNSAVAANVAGDRVGVYLDQSVLTVKVNGAVAALSEGDNALPKGGKVFRQGNLIALVWPDATRTWISPIGSWGLKLEMSLAAARNGSVIGLLGNADRDAGGDVSTRDGRKLPDDPAFADLYPAFADSWRVSQAESLFDYAAGQDTNTFTDRSLPQQATDLNALPNRAAAEATCRAAGVTEPGLLEACILDVALTGAAEFATATAGLQKFLQPSPVVNGKPPGSVMHDGETGSGNILEPFDSHRFIVDVSGATVFWVAWTGPTTECDQYFNIILVDVSTSNFPCTGQAVRFAPPEPGQNVLEIKSEKGGTGHYSFRITTTEPPPR